MNKKDRKAWLRIVEAFLAVLIIAGAVLVIFVQKQPVPDISESIYYEQRQILNYISKTDSLREDILAEDNTEVNNSISGIIPNSWGYATKICDITEICTADTPNDRDIYVTEILIVGSITEYNPKKLRFFVWLK